MGDNRNKTIIKNTMFLYVRLLAMLVISLFTSRIIFQTLGVDDYGTYSVVGGVIVFFTFFNSGLSSATRRFITAALGRGDEKDTHHTFCISINAHAIIALIILILAETIGSWCVLNILNIPEGRETAAFWVYQLSVFSALLSIIQSPYESAIVATEKMDIYAYMSVTDAIFKLLIVYAIQAFSGDKLIIYAWLVFGVGVLNILIRYFYCTRKIKFTHFNISKDTPLLRDILSFTSWSLLGQASVVATNQGVSVLVNIFHNVAVNAAQGVASTINGIIFGFVGGFQTAFNPQIIKSYNSGEHEYLRKLIIRSSKITSYLLMLFLIPLLFEVDNLLTLWLGDYPKYAVEFCILTLIYSLVDSVTSPLWMMISSQTRIKQYQIVISIVYSLNFIFSWVILYLGFLPYHVLTVRFFVTCLLMIVRTHYAKKYLSTFNISEWCIETIFRGAIVLFTVLLVVKGFYMILPELNIFVEILVISIISTLVLLPTIYFLGINLSEKEYIINEIKRKLKTT